MEKITRNEDETHALARELLSTHLKHNVIALTGDLGSGKTTFAQGLGKALGIQQAITSPTFMLMRIYALPGHPQFNKFIHCDLYRVQGWDEIAELSLNEVWDNPHNLIVIEWAERIKDHLPAVYHQLNFTHEENGNRKIVLQ